MNETSINFILFFHIVFTIFKNFLFISRLLFSFSSHSISIEVYTILYFKFKCQNFINVHKREKLKKKTPLEIYSFCSILEKIARKNINVFVFKLIY